MILALAVASYVSAFLVFLFGTRSRWVGAALSIAGVLGAIAAALFLWRAAHWGWKGFLAGVVVALVAIVGGIIGSFFLDAELDGLGRARRFRRYRAALEALAREPAGEVHDPALRAIGVLSFERLAGREFFAVEVSEDNGRTPDRLFGYLRAPSGPPAIGEVLPRSSGRYHEGAKPFRLTRISPVGDSWWSYTSEEIRSDRPPTRSANTNPRDYRPVG